MIVFTNAGIFLMGLIFDLYVIILMLRLLMQKMGANYNPVSQLVIRLTNIFVRPLQRIILGFRGFNLAIVLLLMVFELIQVLLIFGFRFQVMPHWLGLFLIAIGSLGNKFMNLYFYAIIIRVIMSWSPFLQRSSVAEIIFLITEPLMRSVRRFIPIVAGFDFSHLFLLVFLQLISIIVFNPVIEIGTRWAL